MVGKVAVIKLVFQAGGIRAIPGIAAHDGTGKARVARCAYKQRYRIQEAGIIQKLCAGSHGLCCLGGKVSISAHALAGIGDFNVVGLAVFYKSVLQAVGIVIILGINHGYLAESLALNKQGGHLALIRVNEAVTEDRGAFLGHIHVGSAGCQQQHSVIGSLGRHRQCNGREEAAHDSGRGICHDFVVSVHGLLGVLGIISHLAAVDDLDRVAGIAGVDLLHSHIHRVLGALAVNSGAAGHGADHTNTDHITAVRAGCCGGSGTGSICRAGCAALCAGRTAAQNACRHRCRHGKRKNPCCLFHRKPLFLSCSFCFLLSDIS